MKFIHFLYENDYNIFPAQNLSLLQNERSFFSKLFRQHRDEMRFANLALISGRQMHMHQCVHFLRRHNKKAEDILFRFHFLLCNYCQMIFVQLFTDYLFLCKKSGIFKDLVATLERKSVGGFWMPLNAWLTLGMAPVLPGAITTGFLAASCPFTW